MIARHLRLYVAIVVILVTAMAVQSQTAPVRPLAFLFTGFSSLHAFITAVRDATEESFRTISGNEGELLRLRSEVARMSLQQMLHEESQRENNRLRLLLDLSANEPHTIAVARVISRSAGKWADAVIIDKGRDNGVRKDMAVMSSEGLVGKTVEVHDGHAIVLLIDNTRFSAGVRFKKQRTEAIFSGAMRGRGSLRYVSTEVPVQEGDELITSGLGGMFPSGIPVATVTSVYTDERELFHEITARPIADTSRIEEVLVVSR